MPSTLRPIMKNVKGVPHAPSLVKKSLTFAVMRGKLFFLIAILPLIFMVPTTGFSAAQAQQAPLVERSTETKELWFLDAPKEWPAQVMPGVRGGSGKLQTYFDNLIPVAGTRNSMLFADSKTVIGPHNSNEQNVGVGARALLFDESFLAGGNFFYDTKHTENDVRNHQFGFGMEGLSKWFDMRTNFYFPLTDKKLISEETTYVFGSTSLVKMTTPTYEEALMGFDYEGGVLLPLISEYVETRAFLGGYSYFPDCNKSMNGIKGRIEIRPIRALTFEVEIKHDGYNGTDCFVGAFMTIPLETVNVFKMSALFGEFGKFFGYQKGLRPLRERMVDRVIRDIDVTSRTAAAPTLKTKVHDMTFVDNSYVGISDGSLEHPYITIADGVTNATGDKWVYVNKGSGNYAENIILTDSVTLWGSGYNGGFAGISAPGNPVISVAGIGITLANNNTIMGFKVQNGLRGIYGQNIRNTTIDHNTVSGNSQEGILLDIGGSTTGTYTISNNIVTDNSGYAGIFAVAQGTATPMFHINNNTSSNNRNTGAPAYNTLPVAPPTTSGRGIRADFYTNSQGDVRISGNTVQSNAWAGIYTYGYNSSIINTCEMKNNIVSGNDSVAIALTGNNASSFLSVTISGNNVYQNLNRGLQLAFNPGSTGSMNGVLVADNVVTDNGETGIAVKPYGTNSITVTLARNTFTGNVYGVNFHLQSSSSVNATVYDNVISDQTYEGIELGSQSTSTFTGSFYNNTIKDNAYGVIIGRAGYNQPLSNADFGGGTQGSAGHNSIYGNTAYDVKNITAYSVTAQYNWWGVANPLPAQFIESPGTIDHTNQLSSDPN